MTREHVYRTEAIILRRYDLGEADRVLTVYSRDRGKIKVIAKGVRKPTSRKVGHVELFVRTDMLLSEGRTFESLNQVETLDAFLPLREDLLRGAYASHAVELLDAFTGDEDESRPLYNLIRDGLTWFSETNDLQRTARYYELRMLDLAGYRPELFRCVICGEKTEAQDQFYGIAEGGVVCPSCGRDRPRARTLSLRALKVLRYLQTRSFDVVEQLNLSPPVQIECERLLHEVLTYYLERRLKSAAFLDRLRRETPRP